MDTTPSKLEHADDLISLEFTRKEWTILYNIINQPNYPLAAAELVIPIKKAIFPHVVVDSSDNLKQETPTTNGNGIKVT